MLRSILVAVVCAAQAAAQIGFEQPGRRHFPLDDARSSKVSTADFDGDGDLDVVATTFSPSVPRHRFYRNDGQGIFTRHPGWPDLPQRGPHLVVDFDGDGDPDVLFDGAVARNVGGAFVVSPVVSTQDPLCFGDVTGDGIGDLIARPANGLGVQLWRGFAGAFALAAPGSLPTADVAVVGAELGDFDGDGDRDLLLATRRYATPSLYWHGRDRLWRNDGRGNFTEQILPGALDADTAAMAVADFDGDGDLDCATTTVALWPQLAWELRCNDGTGNLVPTPGRLSGAVPAFLFGATMRAMDLDGDGDADIVGQDLWLDNDGTARFTQRPLPMPAGAQLHADGDVDRDGDRDLVFAANGPDDGMQRLLLNDGTQHFVDATQFPWRQAGGATAIADLDGDGDLDVVGNGQPLGRNDGTGWFDQKPFPWHHGNLAGSVLATRCCDADGDGDLDVVYVSSSGTTALRLCRNDGALGFVDVGTAPLPAVTATFRAMETFDADEDGDVDLVIADGITGVSLYRNDGSGAFTHDPAAFPAVVGPALTLAHGDLDGDGDRDLLLRRDVSGSWLVYYANDGRGRFTDVSAQRLQVLATGGSPVALGDLDGDGDLDAMAGVPGTSAGAGGVQLLLNAAGHLAATSGRLPTSFAVDRTTLGDLDGDGDLDAVVRTTTSGWRFWTNLGNAQFVDAGSLSTPASSYTHIEPWLADLDDDGDPDLVIGTRLFANQHRDLSAPWLCRTGRSFRLRFRSAGTGPVCLVWPFFGPRQVRRPAGSFGTLVVDPASAAVLPPTVLLGGEATIDYAIPQAPALLGAELVAQGWLASSRGPHFSPGLRITVGN